MNSLGIKKHQLVIYLDIQDMVWDGKKFMELDTVHHIIFKQYLDGDIVFKSPESKKIYEDMLVKIVHAYLHSFPTLQNQVFNWTLSDCEVITPDKFADMVSQTAWGM